MSEKNEIQVDEKLVKEIAFLARLDLTEEETRALFRSFRTF